ncbi:hypothetical protein M23134_04748 [Microscilla marina ATCC 23134]|uniref:Uncharacterized protein n=1 Tax=Microscilla marina ATCC 23134 TaxID=313606 RepID=A1ZRG9_MICM2|nr:hypothetical protein M23134_04748 [Microscilla marina ATCC 23134]
MLTLAAASCNKKQATVEKPNAHNKSNRNVAPALEAVVMVPGPINAAEIIDQKRIFRIFDLMAFNFYC